MQSTKILCELSDSDSVLFILSTDGEWSFNPYYYESYYEIFDYHEDQQIISDRTKRLKLCSLGKYYGGNERQNEPHKLWNHLIRQLNERHIVL